MLLPIVLVTVQLSASLDCYNARDISLEKAFGLDIYKESTNATTCTIRAIYDAAPNEVVSITMYSTPPSMNNTVGCHMLRRRYPKERAEHRLQLKTSDYVVISCRCNTNHCNQPALIMDQVSPEDPELDLIARAMESRYKDDHQERKNKSTKYIATTIVSICLGLCFFIANLIYAAIIMIGNGRGAGRQELFPARKNSSEKLSDETAE